MSLINDALKKAKQTQASTPARESAPQLRSPETDHPVRSSSSLLWPAIILAVGLVGATFVWLAMSGRKPDARKAGPVAVVNLPATPSKTEPAVAPPVREVVSTPPAVVPNATTTTEPQPPVVLPPPTIAASAPAAPTPVLPRLNGIFFNPAQPTAVVNNKLVSAGSRVGEFTVVAITQTSVTLVGGGQTNVLSLSE